MDLKIRCCDCTRTFIVTVEEQEYLKKLLAEGKIQNIATPKRCKECRDIKKGKMPQARRPTRLEQKYPYLRKPSLMFPGDEELINELNQPQR